MVAAGLLAKKAVERGLTRRPWVKSSLAPGSKVVTQYLDAAGLTTYLEELGFHTVGYGCTTCIGNSGPLPDEISRAIAEGDLAVARRAVREPELRGAHPPGGEGQLPCLAAARRRLRPRRPHGSRPRRRADRHGRGRRRRIPGGHLAEPAGGPGRHRPGAAARDVRADVRGRLHRRRALARAGHPFGPPLRMGPPRRTSAARRTSTAWAESRSRSATSLERAASSWSATP